MFPEVGLLLTLSLVGVFFVQLHPGSLYDVFVQTVCHFKLSLVIHNHEVIFCAFALSDTSAVENLEKRLINVKDYDS